MNKYLKEFCAYFDETYVCTFERAKDRHESIKQQLEGCNYELFMSMDSSTVTLEQLKNEGIYDEKKSLEYHPYKVTLAPGDVACSWGHKEIYKTILRKKLKRTLIFEDDIRVMDHALGQIPRLLENIPKDADLIYWGYGINDVADKFGFMNKLYHHAMLALLKLKGKKGFYINSFPVTQHQMIENMYTKEYNKYFKIAGAHYFTHAYSINEKAAKILMDMQTPISVAADHVLFFAIMQGRIKAYIATPMLFVQDCHTENASMPNYTIR
jgi:glycosyl transferase family 25